MMTREEIISAYRQTPEVSVLIIGAGVNGIGTFRDLALQGVDTLIVDKADFCSGASAASSHMVHGGIRYLENGEFRLVREAVQERNRLIENASHYVKPLLTVIPIFKWFSGLFNAPFKFLGLLDKPSERGAVVIKVGMMFYDAFTRKQGTVPKHQFISRAATLQRYPKINPRVLFSGHYYDGSMHTPERICIDLLLDGQAAHPQAQALNYLAVVGADGYRVTLQDQVSGETLEVQPRVVVNAAGPWIDIINARIGAKTNFIGGTKGSHLILDNPELRAAIGENEFFFENKDGRIVLIFPLKERVMIGTSDIPIDDPDQARCTEDEIDYFVEMVKIVFPDIPVRRNQILFQFSGVRPLPASDADNPGQISRDHSIVQTPPVDGLNFPVYNLVGGKWTSFRAFSEQVADLVLDLLKAPRKTDTKTLAIGGGRDYPQDEAARRAWIEAQATRHAISLDRIHALLERYGTRAEAVAAFIAAEEDATLQTLPGFSHREINYIVTTEGVVHLDDFLLRRSMLAKLGHLTWATLQEVAEVIAPALDWSGAQVVAEVERAGRILREQHGMKL
jgi:glycerol-3-phosphate dehydrogenase